MPRLRQFALQSVGVGVSWRLRGVTSGNKLLPAGIPEGYAKAKLNDSEIKAAVPNFVQIQHNIVDSFTNIIRFEIVTVRFYIANLRIYAIKKPPGGRFCIAPGLGRLNARTPP
jgi:hypothetical protein